MLMHEDSRARLLCKPHRHMHLEALSVLFGLIYQVSIEAERHSIAVKIGHIKKIIRFSFLAGTVQHGGPARTLPRGPLQHSAGVSRRDDNVAVGGVCQGNSGYIKM